MDVTHVRIHSSVRMIQGEAFWRRRQLRIVILNDGLEEIGKDAFSFCALREIIIPNAVKRIQEYAFSNCYGLTAVALGNGLEEIGAGAFRYCDTLREIIIPNAVRAIKVGAFGYCSGLTTVTLGNGLEEIGEEAFCRCTSLREIIIPPAVKEIHDTAFELCSNLTNIEFCGYIEEFVTSEAMRGWWNQGVHERCLSTYCFLVRCSIPARFSGLALVSSWRANIDSMLRNIPTIAATNLEAHFDAIDARLNIYENMSEAPTLIELVIQNDDIVQRVLSFF